jgi:hypothetical protein
MTKIFDEYLEHEEPLTHEFFNTLYWRSFPDNSHQPETENRSFLGIVKGLVNKIGFEIGGGENSGIRCSFYDDDDNKLDTQVLFAFDPADWEEREESFVSISNSEFLKLIYNVLNSYIGLQKKGGYLIQKLKKLKKRKLNSSKIY